MIGKLRLPFFVIALILLVLCVLIELGSDVFLDTGGKHYGLGIRYLALVDGLLLLTVGLIASPLIISHRAHGRIQGLVTFIASLLILIGSMLMAIVAIALVVLMLSLLLAVPFGTLAYMAKFSFFPVVGVAVTLSFLMTLKLGFAVCLILAHQRFLENKGLVLLILTSLGVSVILSFLQNLPPSILVSITDGFSAIVIAVIAAIWALVYLIGSIPAILKALRIDRAIS
jgi:hypothetical protein